MSAPPAGIPEANWLSWPEARQATTLRQQGRDVWDFLEQAWIAHYRGGLMPSLPPVL